MATSSAHETAQPGLTRGPSQAGGLGRNSSWACIRNPGVHEEAPVTRVCETTAKGRLLQVRGLCRGGVL
jgi:hypothetical protein